MTRRYRLAAPFTVIAEPDAVRLVAGEDRRYTLSGPGLGFWLPGLLASCDGATIIEEALARLSPDLRERGQAMIRRLLGERVLVEGTALEAHRPARCRLVAQGSGPLVERLSSEAGQGAPLVVFCQDRLDYEAALAFNRSQSGPWLWATSGPLDRAYVGPVFLPGDGPCLACLLRRFEQLSPAPELYAALREHARAGGTIEPSPIPEPALGVMEHLIRWKADRLADASPTPALYRLHVLEMATMEVSIHRVFADPECPECGDARLG